MAKGRPKVSIITPAYNSGKYIKETIESIQKQSFADYEHIIVDDGSTDDTVDRVQKYIDNDSRIILIKQKNRGAAAARNRAMDIAKGEYVTFVDSDDFVVSNMLDVLVSAASKHNNDVISFNKYLYDNNTKSTINETWLYKTDFLPEVFNPTKDIDKFAFIFAPLNICIFLRRSFIDNNQLRFNTKYKRNEDILFVGQIMALAKKASVINTELYYYRIGMSSNMSSTLDDHMDDGWRTIEDLYDFLVKHKMLLGHVKESFNILSCAVLWHYINGMHTYEGQKYAFGQSSKISVKMGLRSMSDPGDIYSDINFYRDFMTVINNEYDKYLWNAMQRDRVHIKFLTEKINDIESKFEKKDEEKEDLSNRLNDVTEELDRVYNSKSWKIVSRLRSVLRFFKPVDKK